MLLSIDHEHIIKCYEIFEDHLSVHFVFDLVEGGDLFDYLINSPSNKIPDNRAVEFFYQILEALQYLHSKNIVHRDVKPDNFLVYHEGAKIKLKLIDFGFATVLQENKKLTDSVGSLQYIAPEMISMQAYDEKVDIWAAGIVLYNMMTGMQPFLTKNNEKELVDCILSQEINFNPVHFINSNSKNLCAALLNRDPQARLSAGEAKMTPWIQNYLAIESGATVFNKFEPKVETIKNIMELLNQQWNVKNEVWTTLLSDLDYEIAKDIEEELMKNKTEIESNTLQGYTLVSYETFLTAIKNHSNVKPELASKINGNCLNNI